MCYFDNAVYKPQACVDTICHALNNPIFGIIDYIVGTGVSGTLLLVPVSIRSGIPYLVARKQTDLEHDIYNGGSHSRRPIEGKLWGISATRYVVIDDTISTGQTVRRIIRSMRAAYCNSKCSGVILYQEQYLERWFEGNDTIPVISAYNDIIEVHRLTEEAPFGG